MDCLYELVIKASDDVADETEVDLDYTNAARCPLCREKFIWIERIYLHINTLTTNRITYNILKH